MEETEIRDKSIETRDLRLATWLYLNQAQLAAVTPVESNRCSFTFTIANDRRDKVIAQWADGHPTADVREAINAYLYLVHRGKDALDRKGGRTWMSR